MNTRWHDLIVERLEDGGIHLEQQYLEPSVIHLHPQQLRHVAEQFGLVAPNYPDDELSKRLAEQLCKVYLEMADDHRHLSHTLEYSFERLGGFIDGIPDAIFPNHLWDEREERERKKKEGHSPSSDPGTPCPAVHQVKKTQPGSNAEVTDGNPNLYDLFLMEGV